MSIAYFSPYVFQVRSFLLLICVVFAKSNKFFSHLKEILSIFFF